MISLPLRASSVVPTVVQHTATIIFLHGLGDSGTSWADILPDLRPPHAKIICPNAPIQNVTLNGGMAMPAWFDLRPLDQAKDETGIKSAAASIREIIQSEVDAGIPTKRIILGGFSQGGALALFSGLTSSFKLAGILALSTWLPLDQTIQWEKVQSQKILQCHGDEDDMISYQRAGKTANILKSHLKDNAVYKLYTGLGHTIDSEEEQKDIIHFLADNLPPLSSKL